jgi:glycosyltransferase involved in cell wall biosynthesis
MGMLKSVFGSTITISWFASVYGALVTLTAKLLGKRAIIIVGGVDLAKEPEYGYGLWLSPWRSWIVGMALRCADRVLVVDESLKNEAIGRARYDGANIEVLPTGYDDSVWYPFGTKESTVLTIAAVDTRERFLVKGVDILIDVARKLPSVTFALVGVRGDFPELVDVPKNLHVVPALDQAELIGYYRRAKVYFQPSRREGLSNTLCEAMLCSCIPVATNVGGSAHAVGDTGFVVAAKIPDEFIPAIQRALASPNTMGQNARSRIISFFPKHRREQRLLSLVRDLS